jgi:hypothetical protein
MTKSLDPNTQRCSEGGGWFDIIDVSACALKSHGVVLHLVVCGFQEFNVFLVAAIKLTSKCRENSKSTGMVTLMKLFRD